jgi:cofilin
LQSSGVNVPDECKKLFQEFRFAKSGEGIKYIIFRVNDEKTEIIIEKTSKDSNYNNFLEQLPEKECRWVTYDFEYETDEGPRKRIVFISWYVPNCWQDAGRSVPS